ncbi:MAG: phosphoribosylformimino-5-aminoimidazole carboxamide ribotide isomerase [Lachnospiraceae bacterium]|nr:phosphoribosylformimino-5-aminoimidazole carboxamide ribotide isomerase [Lachnospiraceae bacterium]
MKFRPCIDIHNGSVKQIIGGSLTDAKNQATDNFVSEYDATYYAEMYRRDGLQGGHIILLNPAGSEYYDADLRQAESALEAFPYGMQIGGGIKLDNAEWFLNKKASHVIVTSFVFREGKIDWERLKSLVNLVGKEHLVLDLSCRYMVDDYYIVTDRWQRMTKERLHREILEKLSEYCDEFLVHAVDVEGKTAGIEKEVIRRLGEFEGCPVTYAGGIHDAEDIRFIAAAGHERVDFTVGSALDLFGGKISYRSLL